jgi:tagatose-6-phosphate ketose/aldose isomerase
LNDEVNDRGLAMTSSFSNMVVAAQCLAHIDDLPSYGRILESLVAMAETALPEAAQISKGEVEKGFAKICFLGTGALQGVAVESALKVLELTAGRIVTYSESFLGLRHGPLSAIDDDTLLVAFLSSDRRRRSYELDLISEIKRKDLTQKILAVMPAVSLEEQQKPENIGGLINLRDSVADRYRPPVDVILGQLLGLFASIKLGLQPDTPSPRGAITRVVSKVKIY